MALESNDNHNIYYHMDAQWSIGLGHIYFTSPDYLVVQCLVHLTLFHADTINQTGPNIYHFTKLFEGVVGYNSIGVPCTKLVAAINYFNAVLPIVVTAFSTL